MEDDNNRKVAVWQQDSHAEDDINRLVAVWQQEFGAEDDNNRKVAVWQQDSDAEETCLEILPQEDSFDLKWFVWNEMWHVINFNQAATFAEGAERDHKIADATKDAERSQSHLKEVQQRRLISDDLLAELGQLALESGIAVFNALEGGFVLEIDPLENYQMLEPPPGCGASFWGQLVRAVDIAAGASLEHARDNAQEYRARFDHFEEAWRQLSKPLHPKKVERLKFGGLLEKLQKRELNEVSHEASQEVPPSEDEHAVTATALCDPDGKPAVLGSMGLWLDSNDFVMACEEGVLHGLGSAFEIGVHGSVRDWPDVYSKDGGSAVLRGLLREGGPCCAKRVSKVLCPDAEQLARVSGMALPPLQSFANARTIRSKLGYNIVRGWAIYDLMSMETGKGYVAERYWWNTLGDGGPLSWVDFTPRPEGVTELVLAEEPRDITPKRRLRALSQRELALGESLCCLRFPKTVVSRRVELGTCGAIAVALYQAIVQAEARTDGVVRRVMASACIRGATLEELTNSKPLKNDGDNTKLMRLSDGDRADNNEGVDEDNDSWDDDEVDNNEPKQLKSDPAENADGGSAENNEFLLPVMQEVLGLLEGFSRPSQKRSAQEQELESFLEADGVEGLARLTQEKSTWVAATAASALACACHRNSRAQARALYVGAAQALAELFAREDMQRMNCYAAEAAAALWQPWSLSVSQYKSYPPPNGYEVGREHWEELTKRCNGELHSQHMAEPPRERRGHSWGRVLAFAQVVLGSMGVMQRRGTEAQPLVIWVLGAQDLVEGSLAEEGFFGGANWVEQKPTLVVLFGKGLRRLQGVASAPQKGAPAAVLTADYSEMPWLCQFGVPPPDFAAVLMGSTELALPADAAALLAAIAHLPVVISTRFCPLPDVELNFRRPLGQLGKPLLLVGYTRCPFSTSGGNPEVAVDDNGWIFAVRGPQASAVALNMELTPEVVQPFVSGGQSRRNINKTPVIFWGILDIKYNTERPVLDRVKVLETGDGQTSQFSHHGADIKSRFEDRYFLERSVDLDMQHVVSADKKLTHDLAERAGFGHLVPKQACFLRQYDPELSRRIQEELGLGEDDKVVLKLCNRTRAAGVVVTPVRELDEVLEDLLQPPKNLKWWFEDRICAILDVEGSPVELGLGADHSFEEQRRHWWSNESPVFVAEVWCKSVPTERGGQLFDGTMRVGFVLRRRQNNAESETDALPRVSPESLQMEWLGGYWKLPMSDISPNSGSLRECVVSMAKASGTSHVNPTHLMEVFGALDNLIQKLYGSLEPSSQELKESYKDRPELAAFLTARLGTAGMNKRPAFAQQMLEDAGNLLVGLPDSPAKRHVMAFVQRAHGVRGLSGVTPEGGRSPEEHFRSALTLLPTNANALHLLGLSVLPHSPLDAVKQLTRSLLLDPDFKGAYANLALAYLRLRSWERACQVARAGHERHPHAPQLAYHCAVACCQIALELVDKQVEQMEEYEQVREQARRAKLAKEELEQRAKHAKQDADEKHALLKEAVAARDNAKDRLAISEKAASDRGVVAGTKLKCTATIVSFDSPPDWATLAEYRVGTVVTAAGKPQKFDMYRMVPVQPTGYLDFKDLERIDNYPAEEKRLYQQMQSERDVAHAAWSQAVDEHKDARIACKSFCESMPTTISRRPVARILNKEDLAKYEEMRLLSVEMFEKARSGTVAGCRRRGLSPWLEADDAMLDAMRTAEGPVGISLPSSFGWQCSQYRL